MLNNELHLTELNSPIQKINARVELHNGSTLENICTCNDILESFTVERAGEAKFFGYGICQKAIVKILDEQREINLTSKHSLEVSFGVGTDFIYPYPVFYIQDAKRDEDTEEINITAYDALFRATAHFYNELTLPTSYTIRMITEACAALLGMPVDVASISGASFDTYYEKGANFSGSESIRDVLNAIAEVTQTIYYLNSNWELTFKRLDAAGEALLTISRDKYLAFNSGEAITLGEVCRTNDLGNAVSPAQTVPGVTQYVRNNPFWEMREEDIASLVDAAQAAVGGLTITQYECEWFGNYLLEIGDKIELIKKDNTPITTFLLDDSITFDGSITESCKWIYEENEVETPKNPSSLGEAIKQTFARVDKVNNEIQLKASVSQIQDIEGRLGAVENSSSLTMTPEQVNIAIEKKIGEIDSITTSTGFTFNQDGLTISKSDSDINTTITENGMYVKDREENVLTANSDGVNAKNLHATTYLFIGQNSRFEDYYNGTRTGCFWIGG